MPDLLAGTTVLAADFPPADVDGAGDNITGFTNTSPANGSPIVGVAFVAPTSGRVLVSANLSLTATSGQVLGGYLVRTGSTIGSGTEVQSSEDEPYAKVGTTSGTINGSAVDVVEGLTPGASYNVCAVHWTSGTGSLFHRRILVVPLP